MENQRVVYQPIIRTFFWKDQIFFKQNKDEIFNWARQHNCKIPSEIWGWIECPDDEIVNLFMLRWC